MHSQTRRHMINKNIDIKCYLNFGIYNSSQLFLCVCVCERDNEIVHVYIEAYINLTDKRYIVALCIVNKPNSE